MNKAYIEKLTEGGLMHDSGLRKIEIAKQHLLPKQIEENGLKKTQLKLTDKQLTLLKTLHQDKNTSLSDISNILGISKKTIYNYLNS